jgi:hypothetical protein
VSSELSGHKTDQPAETTTGAGAGDSGSAIPGQNITVSRRELFAQASRTTIADHGGTASGTADTSGTTNAEGASGTGGQAHGSAEGSNAGGGGNEAASAGSTGHSVGTSRDANAGQEGQGGGSAGEGPIAGAAIPADQIGSQAETDSPGGSPAVDGSDDGGDAGQTFSTVTPDLDPDSGGADAGGHQGTRPTGDVAPGRSTPDSVADGSPGQPGIDTTIIGDNGREDVAGGQGSDSPQRAFGPTGDSQDSGATESGDQGGGERARSSLRTGADTSQQAQRAEGASEKTAERQGEDPQGQKSKDPIPAQNPSPDTVADQSGDTSPEAVPDQNADDQRWAAIEQRMLAAVDEAKADLKAEHKEEIDRLQADHEAEKAQFQSEFDDLRAEFETFKAEHARRQPDQSDSGDAQADPDVPPVGRGERSEGANAGGDPGDTDEQIESAAIEGAATSRAGREEHMEPTKTRRRVFTAENIGAVTAGAGAYQSVAEMFGGHVPPEVGAASAVLGFVGASMATELMKDLYKKWKGRDER